jgi:phosphoserine aminotransferase
MPKLFRLLKKGRVDPEMFEGSTINTPSMLCVEDYLDALDWAERVGGGPELRRRTLANFAALSAWVERTPWIDFLAANPDHRSETSVCLRFTNPSDAGLVKPMVARLAAEGAASTSAATATRLRVSGSGAAPPSRLPTFRP